MLKCHSEYNAKMLKCINDFINAKMIKCYKCKWVRFLHALLMIFKSLGCSSCSSKSSGSTRQCVCHYCASWSDKFSFVLVLACVGLTTGLLPIKSLFLRLQVLVVHAHTTLPDTVMVVVGY
jgi:hypothetical protein